MMICSHFQAVLYTHDKIACGDYEPHIDPIPVEDEEDETAVKIVSIIKKHNEPLVGVFAKPLSRSFCAFFFQQKQVK